MSRHRDACERVGLGDAGVLRLCAQLVDGGAPHVVLALDLKGVRGANVRLLYREVCGGDARLFAKIVVRHNAEELRRAVANV